MSREGELPMGFFDTCCLITGVNIRSDATAVLLHRTTVDRYDPISLGIRGSYDGFGSIYASTPNENVDALTAFFSNAFRVGRFQARDQTRSGDQVWFEPDITIESLMYLVERTTTCTDLCEDGVWPPSTVLDGGPVMMAMIAQSVWDAVASAPGPAHHDPLGAAFGPRVDVAVDIYGARVGLEAPLRELAAVADFIATHPPLCWAPPAEPNQRYPRGVGNQYSDVDDAEFLAIARRDYAGEPHIQRALDEYARTDLNPW